MIDDFKGQDGRNPHAGRQERNAKVTSAEIEEATVLTGQVPEGQTAAECWRSSAKKVQDVVTDSRVSKLEWKVSIHQGRVSHRDPWSKWYSVQDESVHPSGPRQPPRQGR